MKHYLFLILLYASLSSAQFANLKLTNYSDIKKVFDEEIAVFESIEFTVNGKKFKVVENLNVDIPINTVGFDSIKYSFVMKGKFYEDLALAKLQPGTQYFLFPCTCCGLFMINSDNSERGVVRFKNNSKQNLIGVTGELEVEVLKSKSISKYYFSSVSMNCGFRPTPIAMYTSDFIRKSEEEEFDLKEEKYAVNFLFINGEKITIKYDENKSDIIFDGFLNKGEVEQYYKKYEN